MANLFNTYLYNPLLKFLEFLYHNAAFGDIGIAVIILTILVRVVLFPIFYKISKDQAIMAKIAPRIKEIQEKHKSDKEKQVRETMALYKEHKVNPLSQFFLLLVQLPILIALFKIFSTGIKTIANLNPYFLGFVNLTEKNFIIVIIAAVLQYYQTKLTMPQNNKPSKELNTAERISRNMMYIGPLLTFFILSSLPSVIGLYWLTFSVFSVIQQIVINRHLKLTTDQQLTTNDENKNVVSRKS